MSRTDKDMPYWVRLNNEGTSTDHDHLRFGEVYYRAVPVLDDEGNPVMDTHEVFLSATQILGKEEGNYYLFGYSSRYSVGYAHYVPWSDRSYTTFYETAKVVKAALMAYTRHTPDEQIAIGFYSRPRTTPVVKYVVKDYCTAGEKITDENKWVGEMPCTPRLSVQSGYSYHTWGMSNRKAAKSREVYGGSRALKRATLGRIAKSWNSGEEVDDFDEVERLTDQHRHSMAWDLY
jgi:hypothetical protein